MARTSGSNGSASALTTRRTKTIRPNRTMNVREFLRGGYTRDHNGITVVMNGGNVEGIWFHGGDALRVEVPEDES
jgi:hypothetical protein